MKKLFGLLSEFYVRKKLFVIIAALVLLIFIVLSFFIDIGYIITVLFMGALLYFSKRISKENPDILLVEKNKEIKKTRKELDELSFYIINNPNDFGARAKITELENKLSELKK